MDRWQQQIKTKKVLYEIRKIQEKELFGHQEVIALIKSTT